MSVLHNKSSTENILVLMLIFITVYEIYILMQQRL